MKFLLPLALTLAVFWCYTERHTLFGMHLLGPLHAGMSPAETGKNLALTLRLLSELQEDEQYFDPVIHAQTQSYYGVEITKDREKRIRKFYATLPYLEIPAGMELRFLDKQLFGVDVYFVMPHLDPEAMQKQCGIIEREFTKQFADAIRKDLSSLNGGYGFTKDTPTQHAYFMCDLQHRTATLSVDSKEPLTVLNHP